MRRDEDAAPIVEATVPHGSRRSMSTSLLPDRSFFRELLRPWKLFTFAVAMALLLWGAVKFRVSDWDVGITIIMGVLTYLCAPWSVRVLLICVRERPRFWWWWMVAALVVALAVVDWVYVAYHTLLGNQMYRWWNLRLSSATYFLAGTFWLYRGTLRELRNDLRAVFRPATKGADLAGPAVAPGPPRPRSPRPY
jgi:hypothetical protein